MPSKATNCSPVRYCRHKLAGTCLMPDEIKAILASHGVPRLPKNATSERLVSALQDLVRRQRTTEQSLARVFGRFDRAFRPAAPNSWLEKNNNQWLSSEDIDAVMRQYEQSTPDFKFLGVTPINFDDRPLALAGRCVSPSMCALDVARLLSGGVTKQLGVVLNMDRHDAGGSHWVSMYIGLDPSAPNYGVFYYDSVAASPDQHVSSWMQRVAATIMDARTNKRKKHRKVEVKHNRVRRQFGQSECGIFAMMFLIHSMQQRATFEDVCTSLGRDDAMRSLRSILFIGPGQLPEKRAVIDGGSRCPHTSSGCRRDGRPVGPSRPPMP